VLHAEPGTLEGRAERGPAGGVPGVLLLRMCGVREGGGHGHLDGSGHREAEVQPHGQQLADQTRVAGDERTAVAGQVGAFGERVEGQDPVV
jgi:hypothetical protein